MDLDIKLKEDIIIGNAFNEALATLISLSNDQTMHNYFGEKLASWIANNNFIDNFFYNISNSHWVRFWHSVKIRMQIDKTLQKWYAFAYLAARFEGAAASEAVVERLFSEERNCQTNLADIQLESILIQLQHVCF